MNATNINQPVNLSDVNLKGEKGNSTELTIMLIIMGVVLGAQIQHAFNRCKYDFKPCVNEG